MRYEMTDKKEIVYNVKFFRRDEGFCRTIYKLLTRNGIKPKNKQLICRFDNEPNVFYSFYGEPECPKKKGIKIIIKNTNEIIYTK